jgi:hypothetical protein
MSQDITFMTPGSVWLRDNGKRSILIAISNLSLPEKLQRKNPPVAVFLNEQGDILTMPVDQFMETRQFHNCLLEVETLVDQLQAFREVTEDKLPDASESEEIDVAGEEVISAEVEEQAAELTATESKPEPLVDFSIEAPVDSLSIAQIIAEAATIYSQQPILSEGLVSHQIELDTGILSARGVTLEAVEAVFDPERPDFESTLIPSFKVRGCPAVTWTTYLGLFPRMSANKTLAVLHLGVPTITEEIAQLMHAPEDAVSVEAEAETVGDEVGEDVMSEAPVNQPAPAVVVG